MNILTILRWVVDISIVWAIMYLLMKNIRNNVKLSLLFKGILLIFILNLLATKLKFETLGFFLQYVIEWGPIALIVIFQPEIRTILEQIGKTQLLGRHKVLTVDERERLVYDIIMAVDQMRKARIGALIVIERDVSLMDYINKSTNLYAETSSELLVSLFFPNNPLHDGGVIIQGDKISCAGAVFPTSNNLKINKRLGTRHRAALGITEETDAIAIIVSEETGRVSIAIKGELYYNLSIDDARILLIDELRPKQESFEEEFDEEEDV
ncbi:MAG: diadenylate cyclase CdaA [Bacilli bacterium]|nr:diadenylate cyclase CdaA [Bacilli bacterium]